MQQSLFDDGWPQPPVELEASFARVINVGRQRNVPNIYVGRSFAGRVDAGFGNPFPLRSATPAGRAEALERYWRWLHSPDRLAVRVLERVAAGELAGATLGCWCSPAPCHGHLLAALADDRADAAGLWVVSLVAATS